MILVDHIRSSGVSIRTGYSAESGPWQSGHGVIRIMPYQTEKQLLKALLNAFSHQVLHFDTGRATSRPIRPKSLHQAEALALSYVVARSIGLESLFHDDVIQYSLLRGDEIDWQFRQRIRSAAFALLTNLYSNDRFGKQPRESESNQHHLHQEQKRISTLPLTDDFRESNGEAFPYLSARVVRGSAPSSAKFTGKPYSHWAFHG